jgi:hypothetical protein
MTALAHSTRLIHDKSYEALEAALALIEEPGMWCKGAVSRNITGTEQRCALGAIVDAGEMYLAEREAMAKMQELAKGLGFENLVELNDDPHVKHCVIVGLFKRAIREEKARHAAGASVAITAPGKVATYA